MIDFKEKVKMGKTCLFEIEMRRGEKLVGTAKVRILSIKDKASLYELRKELSDSVRELFKRYFSFSGKKKIAERFVVVLEDLEIAQSERGQGMGKSLLAHILKRFNKKDRLMLLEACPHPKGDHYEKIADANVRLEIFRKDLARLKKFYEGFGFHSVGGTEVMNLGSERRAFLKPIAKALLLFLFLVQKAFAMPQPLKKDISEFTLPLKPTDSICRLAFSAPSLTKEIPLSTRLLIVEHCLTLAPGEEELKLQDLSDPPGPKDSQ